MPSAMSRCAVSYLLAGTLAAAAATSLACSARVTRPAESASALEAAAAVDPIDTAAEFVRWQIYYFRKPEPERVPSAILFVAALGAYDDAPNPSTIGFYGRLFADQPLRLAAWMDEILPRLDEMPRRTVFASLFVAGTEAALAELAKRRDAAAPGTEKEFLEGLLVPPAYDALADEGAPIDLLMGGYLASGDDRYVRKAIDALGRDLFATWVLSSNAARYPEMLAVCREEMGRRPPEVAELLAVVIARAEAEPLEEEALVREAAEGFEQRARTRFR